MTTPVNPAANLQQPGEFVMQDAVILDLPSSSKFSFAWSQDNRDASTPSFADRATLSSSEAESESSGGNEVDELGNRTKQPPTPTNYRPHLQQSQTTNHGQESRQPHDQSRVPPVSQPPSFSRALSMSLPSQLGHLRHPHRSALSPPLSNGGSSPTSPVDLHELSLELADSVQSAIQTMLQISPLQVLDPAKEHISACSLSIPTPSMSAMFTTMKNLNYISANMSTLCAKPPPGSVDGDAAGYAHACPNDFDIGELLQSVGDAMSGTAAQLGVDLVLYHGDVGMKHVLVRGNESGMLYMLSHVIRQMLVTAHRGDFVEIGLHVAPLHPKRPDASLPKDNGSARNDLNQPSVSPVDDGPLRCVFVLRHGFGNSPSILDGGDPPTSESFHTRTEPLLSSLLLRRLLGQIGATLTPDVPTTKTSTAGRTWEITLTLDAGSQSVANTPVPPSLDMNQDAGVAAEPTLEQLALFSESLKGKKATFYADSSRPFAQHMTKYLALWGMEVTHVSPYGDREAEPPPLPTQSREATREALVRFLASSASPGPKPEAGTLAVPPSASLDWQSGSQEPSFILIDDDVVVLKERIQALRAEQIQPSRLDPRKRPPAHHRPRSSHHIHRLMGHTTPTSTVVPIILHYTSLENFKAAKDVVWSVMAGYPLPLPEIMIIPKPAGPRRTLTALHTSTTKPFIDPFFTPTATSPVTPSVTNNIPFFQSELIPPAPTPKSPANKPHRPMGSRSNSDKSGRSVSAVDPSPLPPPSPLSLPGNVEYFPEASVKLGSSPSSGLVIQSPDGQPTGIFFHPRGKTQRKLSSHTMQRSRGLPLSASSPDVPNVSTPVVTAGNEIEAIKYLSAQVASPTISQGTIENKGILPTSGKPPANTNSHRVEGPDAAPAEVLTQASALVSPRRSSELEARQVATPSTILPALVPINPPTTPLIESATPGPSLPLAPNPLVRAETKDSPSTIKGKITGEGNVAPPISVLIVDDNPINQNILSTFMKRKKIKYDLASNGLEAVQKWKKGGFHLILMDIQMPIMDGIEATKEIRRLEKLNATAGYPPSSPMTEDTRTPVQTPSETDTSLDEDDKSSSSPYRPSVIIVALTASSLQSDRVNALAAGCNDFLTKPVSLLWLNNKIIEWGSIKALQMWADLRPDMVKSLSSAQALSVAERLHVPATRRTPPTSGTGQAAGTGTMPSTSEAAGFLSGQTQSTALRGMRSATAASRQNSAELGSTTNATDSLGSETPADSPTRTDGGLRAPGTSSSIAPTFAASVAGLSRSTSRDEPGKSELNDLQTPNGDKDSESDGTSRAEVNDIPERAPVENTSVTATTDNGTVEADGAGEGPDEVAVVADGEIGDSGDQVRDVGQ